MKKLLLVLMVVLAISLYGCSDNSKVKTYSDPEKQAYKEVILRDLNKKPPPYDDQSDRDYSLSDAEKEKLANCMVDRAFDVISPVTLEFLQTENKDKEDKFNDADYITIFAELSQARLRSSGCDGKQITISPEETLSDIGSKIENNRYDDEDFSKITRESIIDELEGADYVEFTDGPLTKNDNEFAVGIIKFDSSKIVVHMRDAKKHTCNYKKIEVDKSDVYGKAKFKDSKPCPSEPKSWSRDSGLDSDSDYAEIG